MSNEKQETVSDIVAAIRNEGHAAALKTADYEIRMHAKNVPEKKGK